ncbi:MAG: hypothetical protein HZB65_02025 [Candidatus Aenigmarchaeota archaeon]|nr:hypothetical protein [Candidatus Aenigmarchaeota archaeon]
MDKIYKPVKIADETEDMNWGPIAHDDDFGATDTDQGDLFIFISGYQNYFRYNTERSDQTKPFPFTVLRTVEKTILST